MASFAHVNLVMGEGFKQKPPVFGPHCTKEVCDNLRSDIKTALGPTMFSMAESNINRAVGEVPPTSRLFCDSGTALSRLCSDETLGCS